jgi:branched-chain amino acid transport system ATP-binding protein
MSAQLEIRGVSKSFGGVKAVSRVSAEAQKGEILSIIGPNGAGKTTLLNCISGVFRPNEGDILLDGQHIVHLSPPRIAALGIARTFQNIALFKGMTVVDNLMLGRHVHMKNGIFRCVLYWGPGQREEVDHRSRTSSTSSRSRPSASSPWDRFRTVSRSVWSWVGPSRSVRSCSSSTSPWAG